MTDMGFRVHWHAALLAFLMGLTYTLAYELAQAAWPALDGELVFILVIIGTVLTMISVHLVHITLPFLSGFQTLMLVWHQFFFFGLPIVVWEIIEAIWR